MKSATLAEHNNDLKAYCATLLDMNAVVDTSANNEELITAFLTQTNTHPSEIVRTHFNQIGIKYFLKRDNKIQSFDALLSDADHLHTVTTSLALPFAASTATTSKSQEHIAALAGMLQKQQSHMRKIVAAVSQINNQVKQRFSAIKSPKNGCNKRTPHEDPPWKHDAPFFGEQKLIDISYGLD
jgi:hypothetical protein